MVRRRNGGITHRFRRSDKHPCRKILARAEEPPLALPAFGHCDDTAARAGGLSNAVIKIFHAFSMVSPDFAFGTIVAFSPHRRRSMNHATADFGIHDSGAGDGS